MVVAGKPPSLKQGVAVLGVKPALFRQFHRDVMMLEVDHHAYTLLRLFTGRLVNEGSSQDAKSDELYILSRTR
jgi:hypothetical protein